MSNSRKRRGSAALPSYMRYAWPRHNPTDQGSLVKAISAAVVLAAAFATGVAHTGQAPKVRASINGARRLGGDHHMDDLENRKAFMRYYRMPEETFDKLVRLLAIHLENNAHMADGLFIKWKTPSAKDIANVIAYYSGSKSGYGINIQAICTHSMRFCNVSTISLGSTNDWVTWNRSCLPEAMRRLPPQYYIIGDAAYPISDQLLTPYPGRGLDPGPDSFNFHLSQLRVKIEQSFGLLVSQWGILWRPLAIPFTGRPDLITAIFHLHNFLRDEKFDDVRVGEEDNKTGLGRPALTTDGRSANDRQPNSWNTPAASRSGKSSTRLALRMRLEDNRQWRPQYNLARNS